jgi:protein MpaA
VEAFIFGQTASSLPIAAYRFGNAGPRALVLGGAHGDETEGVIAAHGLLARFAQGFPYRICLTLVPAFNLDGVLRRERLNARGVDLNRNLPTKDWTAEIANPRYNPGPSPASEPENQALVAFLAREAPRFVLSLHSWRPMLNVNGACLEQAAAIARQTGYRVDQSIGYPTPGCLGTYAGLERQSPTLTYEIERGLAAEPILRVHVPAICESLKTLEDDQGGAIA